MARLLAGSTTPPTHTEIPPKKKAEDHRGDTDQRGGGAKNTQCPPKRPPEPRTNHCASVDAVNAAPHGTPSPTGMHHIQWGACHWSTPAPRPPAPRRAARGSAVAAAPSSHTRCARGGGTAARRRMLLHSHRGVGAAAHRGTARRRRNTLAR
ncbi:hypothetical protein I4F81_007734 [Pyropia yezoensis]|uniref:Uncharacterized protein n=1 Tax=Pyropia yezoensis TaxID=2788 RepID=A0ACC3C4S3_PYRYE|nr:hypothetical protein I4F81_007734 [Neopyropia yezoensis]